MKAYQVQIVKGLERVEVGYKGAYKVLPVEEGSGIFVPPVGMEENDVEKVIAKALSEVKSYVPAKDPRYIELVLKQFDNMIVQYGFTPATELTELVELHAYANVKKLTFIQKRILKNFKKNHSDEWCHQVVTTRQLDEIYEKFGQLSPKVFNILDLDNELTVPKNEETAD